MKSHPLIETALGKTEQRFIAFVEDASRRNLRSDAIRLWVWRSDDEDAEHTFHGLEVIGDDDRVWRIEHSLKRTEAQQARYVQLESRFELTGPGIPDAYGRRCRIEAVVDAALDALTGVGRTSDCAVSG